MSKKSPCRLEFEKWWDWVAYVARPDPRALAWAAWEACRRTISHTTDPATLRQQRDDLLAACKVVASSPGYNCRRHDGSRNITLMPGVPELIRAAIAACEPKGTPT